MTTKFYALLTNQGAAKLANAAALGTKIQITAMAVGDGGGTLPTPDASQTRLVNEKRRAALNSLSIDAVNSSQIIAEQVIPENEGGFWIREIGLFDADGDMVAVANCAETYKPQLQEGSGRTQTIRMILIVNSTAAVTLKIDPSVVLATRKYVDDNVIEVRQYADSLMAKHLAAADPHSQYAPKASPLFTGTPKAPTPAAGNNSTQLANTAFVQAALAGLVGSAPAALDTLKELADAMGNDPHFSATVLNALAGKMDIAKNGSDIADVAAFLKNLGLADAAKRSVGTGARQIPDMSSFGGKKGDTWYKQHPSGLISMGGTFGTSGSAQAQKITVNYPIPFPTFCNGIWFSFQTEDPSQRFCGVFDRYSSLSSFVASVVTPTVNTIYWRAEGY
ncbi:phage tail protein [Mixta calida]|uniref:phage tail protein n=1 Tax=Mixta calida TaxID=665913 RepID=UPI00290C1D56|nr:phage tail protein [Mixta calida]MDU6414741.1 phage tail protein [Mixta calida]